MDRKWRHRWFVGEEEPGSSEGNQPNPLPDRMEFALCLSYLQLTVLQFHGE